MAIFKDAATVHHLPIETLTHIFTLGCYSDPLLTMPVNLLPNESGYKWNQRLPKPFPALIRQVCTQWHAIVEETSNLWLTAICFVVLKNNNNGGPLLRNAYKQFVTSLTSFNSDFVVYLAWGIPDFGEGAVKAKEILGASDEADLGYTDRNVLLFLQSLSSVRGKRANIKALFLRAGSGLTYKCITRLLRDQAAWPRLETIVLEPLALISEDLIIELENEELSVVQEYLPHDIGDSKDLLIHKIRPALRALSYRGFSIAHLYPGSIPPTLSMVYLQAYAMSKQIDATWSCFIKIMRSCPGLRTAKLFLAKEPDLMSEVLPTGLRAFLVPQLQKLHLQRVPMPMLSHFFTEFLFPRLQTLDIHFPEAHDDCFAAPRAHLHFPELHTLNLTSPSSGLGPAGVGFWKLCTLPSLKRMVLDRPTRDAILENLPLQAPPILHIIVQTGVEAGANALLELDLSVTEEIYLYYTIGFGDLPFQTPIILPVPMETNHLHAFSILTVLDLPGVSLEMFLGWVARFFLPSLRHVKGYIRAPLGAWEIGVTTAQGKPGIQSIEELSHGVGLDVNPSRTPLLQTTRKLRIQVSSQQHGEPLNPPFIESHLRSLSANAALQASQADGGIGDWSKVPFRHLETLVIDCGGLNLTEVKGALEKEIQRLLDSRRLLGVPLKEVLYEGSVRHYEKLSWAIDSIT
jgi:hypothetical protein